MMKKKLALAVLALIALQATGALPMAVDYGQIGLKHVAAWFKGRLPVVIDIERLALSLQQLDAEIASNGRHVVEHSVALDRLAEQVSAKERSLAAAKNDLQALRTRFVSLDSDSAKKPVETAMTTRLARIKAQSQALDSTKSALANKRQAYDAMLAAFEKQKVDRDILQAKLESFRAEYETMKMRGELEQSAIANSASRKASDLAIEIADRLEVQRRLAAIQSESTIDVPIEDSHSASLTFNLADVDAVLADSDDCASIR